MSSTEHFVTATSILTQCQILKSGKDWNWRNEGDFQGLSGRGGALKMSQKVTSEFQDEKGVSVKELFKRIMEE